MLLRESNPPARAVAEGQEDEDEDDEDDVEELPGLLGHGEGVLQLKTPTSLPSLGGERTVSVSAGDYHSLALTADGAAWSWGDGALFGKLGHGDNQDQWQPKKIEAFAGQPARRRRLGWR